MLTARSSPASIPPPSATAYPAPPGAVTLTPEKETAAEIHLTAVERAQLTPTRAVPAEIEYDLEKRVPVNAPVEGVVLQIEAN